jgi:hypothetical protein
MYKIGTCVLIILIILLIILHLPSDRKDVVYFFLNKDDDKSLKILNKILKKSKSKIILVNYDKNIDLLKLNQIINESNNIRPIHKIINIENMTDLEHIYRNRKCINQPGNLFYEIKNTVGVYGYPFDFQDSPSELLNNDDDYKLNKPNTDVNKLREYVDVPTCGRRRSGCY